MPSRGPNTVSRAEVATAAGVSLQTVNNWFARREKLSSDTAARVKRAILQLGYVEPRATAPRTLRGRTIAYQLPRAWDASQVNSVYQSTLAALADQARWYGARLQFFTDVARDSLPEHLEMDPDVAVASRTHTDAFAAATLDRETRPDDVAGVILNDPTAGDPRLAKLNSICADAKRPLRGVVLGRPPATAPPTHLAFVDVDDAAGFQALVRKGLVEQAGCDPHHIGHVRFADDQTGPPRRRRLAVRAALYTYGVRAYPSHAIHYHEVDDAAVIARVVQWLTSNPDLQGIVCDCDRYADLVVRAGARLGRVVSARAHEHSDTGLVVAGCDDSEHRYRHAVLWATLRQPFQAWAAAAFRVLDPKYVLAEDPEQRIMLVPPTVLQAEAGMS